MYVPGDTEPATEERLEEVELFILEEAKERRHCSFQLPERRLQEGGCQSIFLGN